MKSQGVRERNPDLMEGSGNLPKAQLKNKTKIKH
jgi:hypothetical protein